MLVLIVDSTLGALLLAAIALAYRAPAQKSTTSRTAGWLLVCIPLPVAVALHVANVVSQATDQALFAAGVVAFAIGSTLVLGSRGDDDWREASDDSPPWWPDFEREFKHYVERPRATARPRALSGHTVR